MRCGDLAGVGRQAAVTLVDLVEVLHVGEQPPVAGLPAEKTPCTLIGNASACPHPLRRSSIDLPRLLIGHLLDAHPALQRCYLFQDLVQSGKAIVDYVEADIRELLLSGQDIGPPKVIEMNHRREILPRFHLQELTLL